MEPTNNLTKEQSDYINKATIGGILGPIYAIAVGLYKEFWMFFIPFYNIYLFIKIIKDGRKMAWEKSNKDFASFEHRERNISKIAKILLGALVAFWILEFVFFVFLFSGSGSDVAKSFTQNIFTGGDVSSYVAPDFSPNSDYITKDAETRGDYKSVFFSSFVSTSKKSEQEGEVKFTNTSMSICVDLEKIGKDWKVSNVSENCD